MKRASGSDRDLERAEADFSAPRRKLLLEITPGARAFGGLGRDAADCVTARSAAAARGSFTRDDPAARIAHLVAALREAHADRVVGSSASLDEGRLDSRPPRPPLPRDPELRLTGC